LLSALLPYQVKNPSSDIHALGLPAGALVLGAARNPAALAQLATTLGVDLTNPDLRYALVKLTRTDGTVTHASAQSGIFMHVRPRTPDPEFGIKREFFKAMTRLRHRGTQRLQDFGEDLGHREATSILAFFKEWGTHFVSEVEVGDAIVQVFAYPSQRFKHVKAAYASGSNPLQGPGATDFAYYTTDFNQGPYGYVKQYGKILNFSNSAAFGQSLAAGAWKDKEWAQADSVFALFNDRAPLTLSGMNQRFTDCAPIRIQLTTLALFVEFKRILFWERVLKGAFVQKYEDSIDANFAVYDQRDFVALLPEDQPGVLSTIATPSINVYKGYLDIGDLQVVAADQVADFTAFANVLTSSAKQPVNLPGRRIRLLGQVLDMRTTGQPKTLVVDDSAFDTLGLACDEFLGALALRNRAASKYSVIVDGLRYGLSGQGRDADPVVVSDVRQVPSAEALPSLIDSLQFSMAFAEAVVSDQSACAKDEIQLFIRSYLRWLAKFVPAQTTDPELLILRVRALDLANYAMNPSYGSFVPILPFSDYQQYVERILEFTTAIQRQIDQYQQEIELRKQAELIINVGETLNKNIIASGDLLSKVIAANAAQQKDMEGYYDSLIKQQKAEAAGQLARVGQLEGLLMEQQAEVDAAVQQYKSAVQRWEAMEAIKFGLEVATSLFDLATTIALPASTISSVEKLGKKVQMIQKIFNVLNAAWKVYSSIKTEVDNLVDAQKALDGLDGAQFGSPSTLSWDELSLNFNEILATGPSGHEVDAAKAHLENAFGVLILRGRALASARSELHQLQRSIYTSQVQQELNTRQAARLDALSDTLRPASIEKLDKSKIDLIGLTGHLGFIQNQMLAILAKAFQQQDQALQYAYLQPPTPISSFSLLKFRSARVKQAQATIEAKSALAQHQTSITTPIDYVVEGVHPEDITNGNVLSCSIPLSAREFYEYVDARVVSVVATVEGIKSTNGGDYLVQLTYEGTPFHDRDTERNALTFRTPRRERVYQYDAQTGAPRFTDGGKSWSEGVSRVTPFATWQVTLPKTQINKGITFASAEVTVRLSFVLEARIVDAETHQLRRLALRAAEPGGRLALLAAAEPIGALPSVNALVTQMSAQGACTNNWDVVFNLSLQQINTALHQQYDLLKTSTSYKNIIDVETRTPVVEGIWAIKKFHIEYGYPSLTFLTNNGDTAKLEMQILSGSVQSCIQQGDNPPKCDPPKPMGAETLTANVKIGKVQGTIQTDGANKGPARHADRRVHHQQHRAERRGEGRLQQGGQGLFRQQPGDIPDQPARLESDTHAGGHEAEWLPVQAAEDPLGPGDVAALHSDWQSLPPGLQPDLSQQHQRAHPAGRAVQPDAAHRVVLRRGAAAKPEQECLDARRCESRELRQGLVGQVFTRERLWKRGPQQAE
jgi:hypothetical protein